MIEHHAVQRFGNACKALGRSDVCMAWCGIAAWMVVGQDDGDATVERSVENNFMQWEFNSLRITIVARDVEKSGLTVEMCHPKAFNRAVGISETCLNKDPSGLESVEFQRRFGTLMSH